MCLAEGTGAKQSSELRLIGSYFWICWTRPAGGPGWQIHAYCLMDNHFHLVVETPRGNLSTGMQIITALGEDVAWDEAWELR